MCWCYGVVRLGWCGTLMQAEARSGTEQLRGYYSIACLSVETSTSLFTVSNTATFKQNLKTTKLVCLKSMQISLHSPPSMIPSVEESLQTKPKYSHHVIYQPTNSPSKTHFMASIKILHVSAPGCHPHSLLEQRNRKPTR